MTNYKWRITNTHSVSVPPAFSRSRSTFSARHPVLAPTAFHPHPPVVVYTSRYGQQASPPFGHQLPTATALFAHPQPVAHTTGLALKRAARSADRIRFVQSVRGNTVLELNGQMFTLNQRKHGTHYWECVKKRNKTLKCNARIVTTADGALKSVRGVHNHRLRIVQSEADEQRQKQEEEGEEEDDDDDDDPLAAGDFEKLRHNDREELDILTEFLL